MMRSKSRENSDGVDFSETNKEETSARTSLTVTVKKETVADRPRTRRFVKAQEALEKRNNVKNEENNEPRRSSRDYNVSIDATMAGQFQVQVAFLVLLIRCCISPRLERQTAYPFQAKCHILPQS